MTVNVLISIPTYGGDIKSVCANSLLRLQLKLIEQQIAHSFMWIEKTHIVHARNLFATHVLSNPEFSHLFFVDADMEFRPEVLLRQLAADRPLVACVCPYRKIDLNTLARVAREHDDRHAVAMATGFNVYLREKSAVASDGFMNVDRVGTALMLIRRDVLETLAPSVRKDAAGTHGFFDHIGDMSEDYSFCTRWENAGGTIIALVDEDIGHVGDFVYRARFIDAAKRP